MKKKSVALVADELPVEGSLVSAFVAHMSPKGCFLRLSNGLTGRAMMKELSDVYIANPEEAYPVGNYHL